MSESGVVCGVARALLEGLLKPSALSLGAAFVVLASAVSFAATHITEQEMAGPLPGLVAESPADYDAFVSGEAIRLRARGTAQPMIVVLGSSSIREAIDPADVAAELAARGRSGISVHNFGTGRQPLVQSLVLSDHVPDGASGVLVVGVGPSRFTDSRDALRAEAASPRLALRSDSLDELLARDGGHVRPRRASYLLEHLGFFVPRTGQLLHRSLGGSAVRRNAHRYIGLAPLAGTEWERQLHGVTARWGRYREESGWNVELLTELVERVQRRTLMRVVLVEHPLSARFRRESGCDDVVRSHRELMAGVAGQLGAQHLILEELTELTDGDFCDWAHLRDRAAIERCGRALAGAVAPLLDGPDSGVERR